MSLADFTLDDFLADLANYMQRHAKELDEAPFGILAVAPPWSERGGVRERTPELRPGVIFCLRQRSNPREPTPNRLQPYFLTHVREDGTVRYGFQNAKETLGLFGTVARGRDRVLRDLVDAFGQRDRARQCDGQVRQDGRGDSREHRQRLPQQDAGRADPETSSEGSPAVRAAEERRGLRTGDLASDPRGGRCGLTTGPRAAKRS